MTLDLGTDNYDKDLIQRTLYSQLERYQKIGSYTAKTDGFTFRDFGGEGSLQPGCAQRGIQVWKIGHALISLATCRRAGVPRAFSSWLRVVAFRWGRQQALAAAIPRATGVGPGRGPGCRGCQLPN